MSNYPNFSSHGYQVIQELGHNRAGGRITYLAISVENQLPVVIKQFQFATGETNWSEYDAIHQEIQVLQRLESLNIPRYLGAFETPTGFCLVQEYKHAPSLAQPRHFTPQEIKEIAVAVLEVLVYLQQQNPPVIHRDIKPENILVDRHRKLNVYLVDFGFARMGGGDVAISSVVKGTLGFMPPEQLFNRQLTEASDLYSLGVTLICLLTGTKSIEIGNLIDEANRIHFKPLIPKLNRQFVNWLEKMVAPSLKNRFENAAFALEALKPIDVVGKGTTLDVKGLFRFPIKMGACVIALSVFSVIVLASLTLTLFLPNNRVQQLFKTGQCPQCNLKGVKLRGAKLEYVNLYRANLESANLNSANLTGATLNGTNLVGAKLSKTNFVDAKLEGANLESANLEGADLGHAKLGAAKLRHAILVDAKLGGANLERANLGGVQLNNAFLGYANLSNAKLWQADLRNANLGYANLSGGNLEQADLSAAKLEGANLSNADLSLATLKGTHLLIAKLPGADLGGADLGGANLAGVNLENARLSNTKLQQANLGYAKLNYAQLQEANLEAADLERAELKRASLMDAKLSAANLAYANLEYARLNNANLAGADLRNAKLMGANLDGASLEGANLENAKLEYVTLKGANLKDANLKGANLKGAIMPDGSQYK